MPPTSDAILVLNAGSSSLKFSMHDAGPGLTACLRGQIDGLPSRPSFEARDAGGTVVGTRTWGHAGQDGPLGQAAALAHLFAWLSTGEARAAIGPRRIAAVGHRVVHGGPRHAAPVRLDRPLLEELDALVPLAPLHQPHNLAAVRAVASLMPELPQVACFDTAFHRSQPSVAQRFGLPRRFHEEGVRRYGFHGLSYEHIAAVLPSIDARAAAGRTIVAHLGAGASMCAMRSGRSVATTMGFTAVDGLPMGTRCGTIDPGVILHLMDAHGMDARAIEHLIYHESGLLGVSGISSDMRALLASDSPAAAEAIALFVHRCVREIGSLAAAMEGLDALVFTAGIGEHAAPVRASICSACAWLGLELDVAANEAHGPRISTPASRTSAWVVPTDEEGVIARHTRKVSGLA